MKSVADIIVKPLITEKSMDMIADKKYAFKVKKSAALCLCLPLVGIGVAREEDSSVLFEGVGKVDLRLRTKRLKLKVHSCLR